MREMWQVKVYSGENGEICISQDDPIKGTTETIVIHPDQVDLMVEWLEEAKEKYESR